MAKKTKIETEVVDTLETPVETAPTTAEELSPLIVSLQSELQGVQSEIKAYRAAFVEQTDKQLAKISELDATIAGKEEKVAEYTAIIEVSLPEAQKKLSSTKNATGVLLAQAETSLAEVSKREAMLGKATAELAKQKVEQDQKEADLNSLSITLDAREKEIAENAKTLDPLKKALGIK